MWGGVGREPPHVNEGFWGSAAAPSTLYVYSFLVPVFHHSGLGRLAHLPRVPCLVHRMIHTRLSGSSLLIAAPYLLFNAFLYLEMRPHDGMFFTILTSLPYVIAVGLCAATMAYKATHNQIN